MIIDILLQTATADCPDITNNTLIYLVGSFLGGSGFAAVVQGFFDVEKTKQLLTLEAQLKLLERDNQYLKEELIEKKEEIQQLLDKNAVLEESQTSGFSMRMDELNQEVLRLRKERQELINRLRKRPQQG